MAKRRSTERSSTGPRSSWARSGSTKSTSFRLARTIEVRSRATARASAGGVAVAASGLKAPAAASL